MFGIGTTEMLVFAVIALVIFGLPLFVLGILIWLVVRERRTNRRE
jgi:hypothetical protein